LVKKMFFDPWKNLFWGNYSLGTYCCAVPAKAYVSVTNYFVNWVVCRVLAHSFAVIDVLAYVDAIETEFRSKLEHITKVFELLQVRAFR